MKGGGGVKLHASITNNCGSGRYAELLENKQLTKRVKFSTYQFVDEAQIPAAFEIDLVDSRISSDHPVVAIFPAHANEQIVFSNSFSSQAKWNKRLNYLLKESEMRGNEMRLAVCYGNCVYCCDGIQGTVYVAWARVKTTTDAGLPRLRENVPVIFNLTGMMTISSIFICKQDAPDQHSLARVPLDEHHVSIQMSPKNPIFVCETKPPQRTLGTQLQLTKLSRRQLEERMRGEPMLHNNNNNNALDDNPLLDSLDFEAGSAIPENGTPPMRLNLSLYAHQLEK
jgi:hypothetical protein